MDITTSLVKDLLFKARLLKTGQTMRPIGQPEDMKQVVNNRNASMMMGPTTTPQGGMLSTISMPALMFGPMMGKLPGALASGLYTASMPPQIFNNIGQLLPTARAFREDFELPGTF